MNNRPSWQLRQLCLKKTIDMYMDGRLSAIKLQFQRVRNNSAGCAYMDFKKQAKAKSDALRTQATTLSKDCKSWITPLRLTWLQITSQARSDLNYNLPLPAYDEFGHILRNSADQFSVLLSSIPSITAAKRSMDERKNSPLLVEQVEQKI